MLNLQYFNGSYESCKKGMHQSIVIKARVDDMDRVEEAIFDLTDSLGTFFVQEDVYFNVPHGNLKLRIMHPNRCGQLIYNSLSKKFGHKLSESQVTEVEDVFSIRTTLGAALGERGIIRKKRRVFTTDECRIYLDDVDEIGKFIDIAVTMKSNKEESYKKAKEIREKLCIEETSMVPSAYLDLLMNNMSFDESDITSDGSIKSHSDGESEGSV